jgi:hypothetical protein
MERDLSPEVSKLASSLSRLPIETKLVMQEALSGVISDRKREEQKYEGYHDGTAD